MLLLSRFSCVHLCATPWTAAHQAPLSTEFSRQEYWSGLPFPSPNLYLKYNINLLNINNKSVQFSRIRLFATPWSAAHQASLSITNSRSSLKCTPIESVMPSSHLILCRPLLLLPPVPPSIRGFSNKSTRRMRWPKYCSFTVLPKNTQDWSPLEWTNSPLLF